MEKAAQRGCSAKKPKTFAINTMVISGKAFKSKKLLVESAHLSPVNYIQNVKIVTLHSE
ncbi:hypothetical protein [Dysosmobacter sp.]|uniref:hypothetical protein n=1 Tax=Dysosmobacter sp. TaxID=2591382 RepID=UPI002DB9627B|nr:hypothetical protein [Dysosmobacter sp.]